MIRRPLNDQFNQAVLDGIKISTIRSKPFPIGVPIMLYNWSGKPYRSKQVDVAPIIATQTKLVTLRKIQDVVHFEIEINHVPDSVLKKALWEIEGFKSHNALQEWFLNSMKSDKEIAHINLFTLQIPSE